MRSQTTTRQSVKPAVPASKTLHSEVFLRLFIPLPHKLEQRTIDLIGVTGAKEMRTTIYDGEIGVWGVLEQLNLLLRIGDGVDDVGGSLSGVNGGQLNGAGSGVRE